MTARLYAGASGWSYPTWKPGWYPADAKPPDFLAYYAARLPTVGHRCRQRRSDLAREPG